MRFLLLILLLPVFAFGQYRANKVSTNPNVSDGIGYGFRGHMATASSGVVYPSWYKQGQVNDILVIGNSFTRGANATSPENGGYAQLFIDSLKTLYGDGGSGFYYFPISGQTCNAAMGHWNLTGNFIVSGGASSPGFYNVFGYGWSGGTAIDTITCNKVRLIYWELGTPNKFTAQIDAETPITIGRNLAYDENRILLHDTTINISTTAAHKIAITPPVSNYVYFGGAIGYSGNSGVNIIRLGMDGAQSLNYGNDTLQIKQIDAIRPSLTVIELGINDYLQNVTLANYSTRMRRLITRCLAYGEVILFKNIEFNTSCQNAGGNQMSLFNDTVAAIASDLGCKVVDLHSKFASITVGTAQGFQELADGHPTDAGHRAIANKLISMAVSGVDNDTIPSLTIGSELLTNGDFTSGGTGWTDSYEAWTYSGGRAVCPAFGTLKQTVLTVGKSYLIRINVQSYTSGYLRVYAGNNYIDLSCNQNYVLVLESDGTAFTIYSNSATNATVDNVSVKEITL